MTDELKNEIWKLILRTLLANDQDVIVNTMMEVNEQVHQNFVACPDYTNEKKWALKETSRLLSRGLMSKEMIYKLDKFINNKIQ